MKKIIPFNNILKFNSDIKEITAISLEHKINKYEDLINGIFYISGEYKITDGQLEKEKFNFELPFDIALTNSYVLDTLVVDIDDFRYNLISDRELKVNIDLYIDGEELNRELIDDEIKDVDVIDDNINILDEDISDNDNIHMVNKDKDIVNEDIDIVSKDIHIVNKDIHTVNEDIHTVNEDADNDVDNKSDNENEIGRVDLLTEMLDINNGNNDLDNNIVISNDNNNINSNVSNNDEYVTYRVYVVREGDSVDSILSKYNVTKEMLEDYNDIENINVGDKLIIPTNEK